MLETNKKYKFNLDNLVAIKDEYFIVDSIKKSFNPTDWETFSDISEENFIASGFCKGCNSNINYGFVILKDQKNLLFTCMKEELKEFSDATDRCSVFYTFTDYENIK